MMVLKDVTMTCVDDVNTASSFQLLSDLSELVSFGDVVLISSKPQFSPTRNMASIRSIEEYNKFILYDLYKYINTDFCMLIQTDGYFINLEAWRDDFLDYDYIGAPWQQTHLPENKRVGNGGFSIRSRKLLELAAKNINYDESLEVHNSHRETYDFVPEDVMICNFHREKMESLGVKYAPIDLASKFSVENGLYQGQFGFHGKATFKINFEEHLKKYF